MKDRTFLGKLFCTKHELNETGQVQLPNFKRDPCVQQWEKEQNELRLRIIRDRNKLWMNYLEKHPNLSAVQIELDRIRFNQDTTDRAVAEHFGYPFQD